MDRANGEVASLLSLLVTLITLFFIFKRRNYWFLLGVGACVLPIILFESEQMLQQYGRKSHDSTVLSQAGKSLDKIPRSLIFVDTRYHNISQFPRLMRENVNNTIQIYANHWNKTKVPVWFLGDEQCRRVIQEESSQLLQFYLFETFGAYKSDICRIAALHQRGGYYFDNDMEVVEAMSLLNATFIMTIAKKEKLASNTFIAATSRHVVVQETMNAMLDYYKNNYSGYAERSGHMGPKTLWDGYDQAAKKYYNSTWSIDLESVNLDEHKELYPKMPRRRGWGCCCNYVIHSAKLQKIYFWSRFLGSGGSCRFRGGKTADDID